MSGASVVGFFTAGFSIVNGYVGMIFTAMATDYYPRLASVNKDNKQCREIVNQQIEVAVIILIPLMVLFIMSAPLMIRILFSEEFLCIVWYMRIAMTGILFKAISWAMSYQFIAKQDMKSFLVCEVAGNAITLVSSILGYQLYGLNGLGVAFIVSYVFFTALVFYVSYHNYQFSFSSGFFKLISKGLIFVLLTFAVFMMSNPWIVYPIASVILILSGIMAYNEFNKRMELTALLKKFRK